MSPRPSRHAIQRFQQRVAPVSIVEANRRLTDAAANARVRATPRWWTPVAPAPGLVFLYPASMPGVCLLVRNGVIMTIYERSQCRSWEHGPPSGKGGGRSVAYRRPSPGEQVGEAA
ncbi:MAG: hypothetical protein ABR540_05520 [Acidimicrobiales bacterium]